MLTTDPIAFLKDIALAVKSETASLAASGRDPSEHLYTGADGTSTKLIDKVAEDVILAMTAGKALNVLSEEAGLVDRGGELTLVIDPVDGTNNAVWGLPLYAVSLALGRTSVGDVEAGLVMNLVTGDTFSAVKGKGARFNGEPIRTRPFVERTSVFSGYVGKKAPDRYLDLLRVPAKARYLGSSALEMCYVAKGSFDLFVQSRQNTRVIDIAASCLILREAGGEVYDDGLNVFDMGFDLKERRAVVAVGDDAVLAVVRPLFGPTSA